MPNQIDKKMSRGKTQKDPEEWLEEASSRGLLNQPMGEDHGRLVISKAPELYRVPLFKFPSSGATISALEEIGQMAALGAFSREVSHGLGG